jgi:rubrerythrin
MNIKGSQTETNILTAFAGESQARNRYTFYAEKARKEGFEQIADIFEETADQEKAHANRLYKLLPGGEVEIKADFPAGKIAGTEENLRSAAAGEEYEETEMYPGFAKTAREEGFDSIADIFEAIAIAERQHKNRYVALADNVADGRVFARKEGAVWRCLTCGYLHEGTDAPRTCPACAKSQAYFELLGENW